jgi:hypothetical protein
MDKVHAVGNNDTNTHTREKIVISLSYVFKYRHGEERYYSQRNLHTNILEIGLYRGMRLAIVKYKTCTQYGCQSDDCTAHKNRH